MKIYTIFDAKAEFYNTPFFARTNAEAMRMFQQMISDRNPNNMASTHPEDFTLFEIGSFDELIGSVERIDKKSLANGVDFAKSSKDQ